MSLHKSVVSEPQVLFRRLPLGARFRYVGGDDVWVVIERHGTGLIAKWEGNVLDFVGQTIASVANSDDEVASLMVVPLTDTTH